MNLPIRAGYLLCISDLKLQFRMLQGIFFLNSDEIMSLLRNLIFSQLEFVNSKANICKSVLDKF